MYSEDSIHGTPFVQGLVSHLHKNPTHKLHSVWYCEIWFNRDRPIYIESPFICRPTAPVLTVVEIYDNQKLTIKTDLFETRAAPPPSLNRQLQTSMDLSLPVYQFWVMFSWLTMRHKVLGRAFNKWLAMSTQTNELEQSIPDRLYVSTSGLILNLLTIIAAMLGVGA